MDIYTYMYRHPVYFDLRDSELMLHGREHYGVNVTCREHMVLMLRGHEESHVQNTVFAAC